MFRDQGMTYTKSISEIGSFSVYLSHIYVGGVIVHSSFNRMAGFHSDKMGCVNNAIRFIMERLPDHLPRISPLNVMLHPRIACEACWWPEGPGGKRTMFVGDKIFDVNDHYPGQSPIFGEGPKGKRGIPDQLRDAGIMNQITGLTPVPKRSASEAMRGIAAVVHEFGHFLHEANRPAMFWSLKMISSTACVAPDIGIQVSGYATINPLEFVAEVFTGLVFGLRYSEAVIAQYHAFGGVDL
ncbi:MULTISPECIES: hypothetical protein [unclassified Chelatococcus]|uniref:hypothetical protein n=1 Tax=unclassified Chelatococcus TaxID=2638111 RepID=UPI001BCACC8A|nr:MULTISPECIES: hypothetical protein [unclassified Chelatococcus]MBS7740763.1 hypothetical protein [Chelatococcus sp. HY11]MBX3546003.1 hypothetical protein [Chelatococcus sp.]MCO5079630.1 hypothetical protein [Chelatococcus sp.]